MPEAQAVAALDQLAEVYGAAFTRLLRTLGAASTRLVVRLLADGPTDEAATRMAALWPELLAPAQAQVGRLAEANLVRQGEIMAVTRVADPIGPERVIVAALPGTLVTPDTPSMTSPVKRLQRYLTDMDFTDALQATGRYADEIATTAMRASEQAGADDGYRRHWKSGQKLRWRRVPDAGACGWCRVVADRLYSDLAAAGSAGWHAFCRCSWRAATPAEASSFTPTYTRKAWKEIIDQPAVVPAE